MERGTAHSVRQVAESGWSSKFEIQDQSGVIGEPTLPAFSHASPPGSIWRSATVRKREETTTQLKCGLFDAEITAVPQDDKMKKAIMSAGDRVRRALMDWKSRCARSEMPLQLGQRGRRRFQYGTHVAALDGMKEAVDVAAVDEQDLRRVRQLQRAIDDTRERAGSHQRKSARFVFVDETPEVTRTGARQGLYLDGR